MLCILGGLASYLKSLHFACMYVIAVLKLCFLEYFLIEFIEKKNNFFMFMIALSIDKKKKCFKGKTIFLHIKSLNCYCMNQHANATIDIYMLNTIVFDILVDYLKVII